MAVLVPIFGGGGGPSTGGITVTIALTGQLNDLDDVVINNPQNGQLLSYNGFIWTNQALYLPSVGMITGMQRDISGLDTRVQTVSSDLNTEIITRLNADNFLQHQINEIATGYRLVFCEQFVGDGVSTSFQLSGAVTNAQIISGSWRTANVQNALPVNITDLNGKPIYDAGILSLFTRHRISVTGLNGSSLGSLDYPPQLGAQFKIWYWYELSAGDRVDNYYRDDYVASMEETDGKLASAIAVDTSTFTTVLSSADSNVQLALNRLDKHTHADYLTSTVVSNISSNLQSQITSICATNNSQSTQISQLSGTNISQASQIASLSANAVSMVHVAAASANALVQTTNNLSTLIFTLSGNDSSQASQIASLSGRPLPDIFRAEIISVSSGIDTRLDNISQKIFCGGLSIPNVTITSGGLMSVSSISANVNTTDDFTGNIDTYNIAPLTNYALSPNVYYYLTVIYNGGTPIYDVITDNTIINHSDRIAVCNVFWENMSGVNEPHIFHVGRYGLGTANKIAHRIIHTERFGWESGLSLSETVGRVINISSGVIWYDGEEIHLAATNSTTTPYHLYYHSAPNVWTVEKRTAYSNTEYDDNTGGLQILNPNKYAVSWVYRGVSQNSDEIYVVLGSDNYDLISASSSQPPATLPPVIAKQCILVGRIIAVKNASTATVVDSAFDIVFSSSGVINHNDLTNIQGGTTDEYYHLNAEQISGYIGRTEVSSISSNLQSQIYALSGSASVNTSVQLPWKFSNNTASGDPGIGKFRINSAEVSASSAMYISNKTDNNIDAYNILNNLTVGDKIYLQNSAVASEAILVTINNNITNNTTWFSIPYVIDSQANDQTFTNNKVFSFVLISSKNLNEYTLLSTTASISSNLQSQITSVFGENTSQATQISNISGNNTSQATQIAEISGNNTSQATQISNISGNNISQATQIAEISGNNTSQATQIAEISGNNTSQATQIAEISGNNISQATQIAEISGRPLPDIFRTEIISVSSGLNTRIDTLQLSASYTVKLFDEMQEPTGFADRTTSIITYNTSSGVFNLSGNYVVYSDGVRYNKSGESFTISASYGTTFIKYVGGTGTANLNVSKIPWDLSKDIPIAYVFFNNELTDSFVAEERHGLTMDGATHYYLHFSQGAKYKSGFTVSNFVIDSDAPSANKYTVNSGEFFDEDILNSVQSISGNYTLFYRTGNSGNWTWIKNQSYPYFINTGEIQYNQFTGATWQLTNITTNNRWVNYYIFATNALTTGFNLIMVPGQTVHSTLAEAQAEQLSSLSLGTLPFAEIISVAKVTHHYASGFSAINGRSRIDQIVSTIGQSVVISQSSLSNHNSLSGLQGGSPGEFYHLSNSQYTDFIGRTEVDAISASFVKKQGDTVYGQIKFQNGDETTPQVTFESHPNTGLFIDTASNDALSISTGGVKRLEISQGGGVQIGGVPGAPPGAEVLQLGGVGYVTPNLPNVRLKILEDVDSYAQTNLQNLNSGESASSDYVATNDIGDDYAYWVDFGINSSNYTSVDWTVNGKNDAYLLAGPGVNLAIGTTDVTSHLTLFAGGTLSENEHVRIMPDGGVQIGGPYDNSNSPGIGNIRLTNMSGGVSNSIIIHDATGTLVDSEITVTDILALSQNSSASNILIISLSGQNQSQASQIGEISGNNISQASQIGAISGNNISQASQIISLSGRPIADIFRIEVAAISSGLYTELHTLSASDISYTPGTSAYWYKYPQPTNSLQATDILGRSAYINRHAINKTSSTGLAVGGDLVSVSGILSGSSFSISGGFGYIVDQTLTDPQDPQGINPTVYTVQWNAFTNVSVTQNITAGYSATYVLIDKNGNYVLSVSEPDSVDIRDNIFLGKVSHRFGAVNSIRSYSRIPDEVYAQVSDISLVLGTININGNEYSPASTNLTLKKSSGSSFRFSSNADTNAKSPHISIDPSIDPVSFRGAYRGNVDGSSILYTSSGTTLHPSLWDNGTGVLQSISGGNWTIKRVYFFPITNSTYIFYGQEVYTTLAAAKDGISTENFKLSDDSFNSASLRAWILVRDDATDLSDANTAVFVNSGKFGGTAGGGGGITTTQFSDSAFYIYDDAVPTNKIKFNLDNMTTSGKTITLSAQSVANDTSLILPNKSGVIALDSTIQAMSGTLYALIASSSGQGTSSSGGITGSYVSSVNGVSGNVTLVGGNGISISTLTISVTADYIFKSEVNAISSSLNGNNISQASQIAALSGNSISVASQIAELSANSGSSLTLTQVSNASANAQIQTTNNLAPLIFALSGNSISVATQISSISGNNISQASQIAALSGRPIPDIFRIEVAAVSAGLNTRINNITGGSSPTFIVAGPGITASQNGNTWTIGVTGSTVAGSGSGYAGPYPDIFRVEVAAVSSNLQTQINNITIGGVNVNSAIIVMSGSQIVDRKDSKLFEYDGSGNLVGLTGSVGVKRFNYNINGDLISISGSGLYQTKSFQYDGNGNLISVGVI